ncbi:Methylamine utilization protein mauG precursor [Enhygromyxa salina]|uniref:Methylamine utilization protein mauG n=1 Tax=Enhygromyxa salina TaxID=215803 RepID=A0A0C2D3H2_9BACT|nr:cytochrome c peroxidase [Enhygromyxa salina]KIG17756.1 Methylamine utilization protein mauG precursor [Enhygromyxa salina]
MSRQVIRVLALPGLLSACVPSRPPDPSDAATTESSTSTHADTQSDSESGSAWTAGEDSGTTGPAIDLDEQLAALLEAQPVPVEPLEPPAPDDPALVALGGALFFDPILSGPKDTACATCHHPSLGTSDGLSLTLGTGAVGLGPMRAEGPHPPFGPRHSQALFNLGQPGFTHMFWDGRVQLDARGQLQTPAGPDLLPGLHGPLAAQAMFPVLDRQEMRGEADQLTVLGEPNELGALADDDPQAIWAALMVRLGAIDGYVALFAAAYPDQSFDELTFVAAANAIAAYERQAFSFPDAPWDAYLRDDISAISDAAKLGAILFYGAAGCGACHVGPLLTDHLFHSTGVPQLGPGNPASAPFDHGRELDSHDPADRFAFRTPSLRNVAISPPYMHDGALLELQQVLVHYGSPTTSIVDFDPAGLLPELIGTVQQGPDHIAEIVATLSELLELDPNFVGLSNLREFLKTLTDPSVATLPELRPDTVPSGLAPP